PNSDADPGAHNGGCHRAEQCPDNGLRDNLQHQMPAGPGAPGSARTPQHRSLPEPRPARPDLCRGGRMSGSGIEVVRSGKLFEGLGQGLVERLQAALEKTAHRIETDAKNEAPVDTESLRLSIH